MLEAQRRGMADGGMARGNADELESGDGGTVRGPGGPTEDGVGPVALSPTEYVLPADTVKAMGGPAALDAIRANGRPTLLAQAGIHSGEIDGKDAGMMLLRDLAFGGKRASIADDYSAFADSMPKRRC
jgi:hypothetical protein